jgi:hypothetical protein
MDHQFIEDRDVVWRYLTDRLEPEEVVDFEDHFVDCPNCLEALETEGDLQRALRHMPPARTSPAESGTRTPQRVRSLAAWTAAAAVLVAAVSLGGAYVRMRRELADATTRIGVLEQQNVESLARSAAPPVAVFELRESDGSRSANDANDTAAVDIPPAVSLVVLALPVENAAAYLRFQAEIFRTTPADTQGRSTWRTAPLFPASSASVGVSVPPALLPPGTYRIVLEGVTSDGRTLDVAQYKFRTSAR